MWPIEIFHLNLEMEEEKLREIAWLCRQGGGGISAQTFWLQVWGFRLHVMKAFQCGDSDPTGTQLNIGPGVKII